MFDTYGKIIFLSIVVLGSPLIFGDEPQQASLAVSLETGSTQLQAVEIELICNFGDVPRRRLSVTSGTVPSLPLSGFKTPSDTCQLRARLPKGYAAQYEIEGQGGRKADRNGCQLTRMRNGDTYSCAIEVTPLPARLTVYKQWIGGSGEEPDVPIALDCENGESTGLRYINEGKPDGWDIGQIGPGGILCNVSEVVPENVRPDIIDCQGLYILPGTVEECTMINTKIVKHIEMLNRYGLIIMTLLVFLVGLKFASRYSV